MYSSIPRILIAITFTLVATSQHARAEKRGTVRFTVTPLELEPASDTPFFGGHVDDAVEAYNAAADAYNEAHGYMAGSPAATARIDRSALGVRSTMFTIAPGVEGGASWFFVRLEAQLGLGDTHRSYGVGFYPINLAGSLRRGTIVPYLSLGGSVAWLDDLAIDGELGGLFTARAAAGARLAKRMTIEVGYGITAIGGVLERGRLDTMTAYDPRGGEPPPHPTEALAGGEQQGLVDVSIGFTF